MNMVMVGVQFLNLILLVAGIAGFVLFIIVLFKLNKALTIWLEQHKNRD